jgi:hypothetical protein
VPGCMGLLFGLSSGPAGRKVELRSIGLIRRVAIRAVFGVRPQPGRCQPRRQVTRTAEPRWRSDFGRQVRADLRRSEQRSGAADHRFLMVALRADADFGALAVTVIRVICGLGVCS